MSHDEDIAAQLRQRTADLRREHDRIRRDVFDAEAHRRHAANLRAHIEELALYRARSARGEDAQEELLDIRRVTGTGWLICDGREIATGYELFMHPDGDILMARVNELPTRSRDGMAVKLLLADHRWVTGHVIDQTGYCTIDAP